MNDKQRRLLVKNKARLKEAGITTYGTYLKLKCSKCHNVVSQRVSNPDAYTPEVLKDWQCAYCRLGVSNPKEEEMAVKKVASVVKKVSKPAVPAVPKVKKESVDDIWYRILHAAVGKKIPDGMLAEQMQKANPTGKKYTAGDVSAHRSGYNCGKYACQAGKKPTVRLEKYEPIVPDVVSKKG